MIEQNKERERERVRVKEKKKRISNFVYVCVHFD